MLMRGEGEDSSGNSGQGGALKYPPTGGTAFEDRANS